LPKFIFKYLQLLIAAVGLTHVGMSCWLLCAWPWYWPLAMKESGSMGDVVFIIQRCYGINESWTPMW